MDGFEVAFFLLYQLSVKIEKKEGNNTYQHERNVVFCSVDAFNSMTIGHRRRYLTIKFVWDESGLFTDESPESGGCGRGL